MDYFANVRKLEDKLGAALVDRNLLYSFRTSQFPIVLTVSQNQDVGAQMDLLAGSDGSVSSADAVLRLIFKLDALEIQTDSRFVIPDDLLTKIKSIGKKWHYAYLQAFFAEVRKSKVPEDIDDSEDDYEDEERYEADAEEDDSSDFDDFYGEEPDEDE